MKNGNQKAPDEQSAGWLKKAVRQVRKFAYAGTPASEVPQARLPKVGVALGGGFARGIAHLGVLHALAQQHIPIDCISGTSAGALAGMAFTCGKPFEEIVREAAAIRFGNFGQWRFSRMGLASNQRLESYPKEHLGVTTFEELSIPLAVSATDLLLGEAVYFTKGLLGPPLRASCAYPGLFRPVEYQDRLLVDGFLAAAMPIEGVRMMGAELVVAVFLEAETVAPPTNVVDVIGRSFSIARLQADAKMQQKADVVIVPKVREFAWDDFARTSELVVAGEKAAMEAMPRIHAALKAFAERRQGKKSGPPRFEELAKQHQGDKPQEKGPERG